MAVSTLPTPPANLSPLMPEKSYLVQKFAKIPFGSFHLIGYSVAGEETVIQVPELNVCFDIGRCPYFALTSDIICLSHGHMDHIAGLPYYLSQRHFQGMKPGTILLPRELEPGVDSLLKCWRQVERQGTPYTLVPLSPGDLYEVRRDLAIRAFATHHGGASLGYAVINVREKLKPEYLSLTGPQIAALRKQGEQVQYRLEVPLVAFMGDTTAGSVFEHPDVRAAQILISECTFFDADHKQKAKAGRHMHVDHFVELLATLQNQHIVLTHVSRRTGVRRARSILRRKLPPERLKNIHFLMDFEGAADGGDVEEAGPNPQPDAAPNTTE
jgi:ribonuclease Z